MIKEFSHNQEHVGHVASVQSSSLPEHKHMIPDSKSCCFCVNYLHYIPGGFGYLDKPACVKKNAMNTLECNEFESNFPDHTE